MTLLHPKIHISSVSNIIISAQNDKNNDLLNLHWISYMITIATKEKGRIGIRKTCSWIVFLGFESEF